MPYFYYRSRNDTFFHRTITTKKILLQLLSYRLSLKYLSLLNRGCQCRAWKHPIAMSILPCHNFNSRGTRGVRKNAFNCTRAMSFHLLVSIDFYFVKINHSIKLKSGHVCAFRTARTRVEMQVRRLFILKLTLYQNF